MKTMIVRIDGGISPRMNKLGAMFPGISILFIVTITKKNEIKRVTTKKSAVHNM